MIAVHGGAGPARRGGDRRVRVALVEALEAGAAGVRGGGSALEAVRVAVAVLEDFPGFNAGVGSVLNRDGEVEMDAGLMCGATRRAGAVAAVRHPRHPIDVAAELLRRGGEPLLVAGPAADALAVDYGLETRPNPFFVTERQRVPSRWRSSHAATADPGPRGTVGAVALDRGGHLAAATSTGGVRGKPRGRVGDSPLPGAGFYADDQTCAVSATGDGEAIMRAVLAHDVAARVRLAAAALPDAAEAALREGLSALRATGGLIALSPIGGLAMPFTTETMARGVIRGDDPPRTAVGPESPS